MIKYNFEGKTALVTGGTSGIGKAIALALLQNNAKVGICYSSNIENAKKTAAYLHHHDLKNFLITRADVSKRQDVEKLISIIERKWKQSISLIVNNAGILKQGDFFKISDKQWEKTLSVNLEGPFIVCQICMPKMEKQGCSIVNISSVGGQIGGDKAPDYAASKAAIISLTRSLARIGSKFNIRVNAVAPGWIRTPIFTKKQLTNLEQEAKIKIPLGRMGNPEEVARVILFLLSGESSFITGQVINVNGGMYFG